MTYVTNRFMYNNNGIKCILTKETNGYEYTDHPHPDVKIKYVTLQSWTRKLKIQQGR